MEPKQSGLRDLLAGGERQVDGTLITWGFGLRAFLAPAERWDSYKKSQSGVYRVYTVYTVLLSFRV